jgi:hypothetical protein
VTRKLLIHTVKDGDVWVNVRAGIPHPLSSSATKALARSRARALARRTGRSHVVRRADGGVSTRTAYGRGSALLAG